MKINQVTTILTTRVQHNDSSSHESESIINSNDASRGVRDDISECRYWNYSPLPMLPASALHKCTSYSKFLIPRPGVTPLKIHTIRKCTLSDNIQLQNLLGITLQIIQEDQRNTRPQTKTLEMWESRKENPPSWSPPRTSHGAIGGSSTWRRARWQNAVEIVTAAIKNITKCRFEHNLNFALCRGGQSGYRGYSGARK